MLRMMIIGSFQFFAGACLYHAWFRHRYIAYLTKESGHKLVLAEVEMIQKRLGLDAKEVELHLKEVDLKVREMAVARIEHDPLTRITIQDALMREERAKAGLRAVLSQNGCSEEQILRVMNEVDGRQEGDLS